METAKPLHEIWAAQVKRHQNENNALLMQEIERNQNALYRSLGPVGEQFIRDFSATGCHQEVNIYSSARASYIPYTSEGFYNHIVYGTDVLSDETEYSLFGTRTHEGIHCLQFLVSAASHASIYNQNTNIVLCPRDAVMLEELKEAPAIAMSKLFRKLRTEADSGNATPPTAEDMTAWLTANTHAVLDEVNPSSKLSEREYYRNKVLGNDAAWIRGDYRMMHQFRSNHPIIFVRLDEEDKQALHSLLGLEFYGDTDGIPPLTESQEANLANVNALWKIDESALPSFGDVLKQNGLTRETFMAGHRAGSFGPDVLNKPAVSPPVLNVATG